MYLFFFPFINYSFAASTSSRCANVSYPQNAFRLQPDDTKVYLLVSEIQDSNFIRAGLVKFSSVFGIRILGERGVDNRKILHVATNLAELLDSRRVGKPASEPLIRVMQERHATLAIAKNNENVDRILNLLPASYECVFFLVIETEQEIIPGGKQEPDCPYFGLEADWEEKNNNSNRKYDKCIGLIADFVIQTGYPYTYPPHTELGELLSKAFVDSINRKWLNVNKIGTEGKCNRKCQEIAFQSWALTSALGVDSCTCRKYAIWSLCTPNAMKIADPKLYGALTQDIRKPTGSYSSKNVIEKNLSMYIKK